MAYKGKRKWLKKDEHDIWCGSENFTVIKSWKMGSKRKLIHGGRIQSLAVTLFLCNECAMKFREYKKEG